MSEAVSYLVCWYSCPLCGITNAKVQVKCRESKESVTDWMEQQVIRTLSENHRMRSPNCHPKQLEGVRIPTTGANYIGGPTVQ